MNKNLTELQINGIKEWDGKKVLSVYPRGSLGLQDFAIEEEQRYNSTEFWCAMKKLDDLKVPRIDMDNGQTYSIVGRIMLLSKKVLNK